MVQQRIQVMKNLGAVKACVVDNAGVGAGERVEGKQDAEEAPGPLR